MDNTLYASDVKIPASLSGAIGGAGGPGYNAYNNISTNYAGAKQSAGADASARGMNPTAATAPSSYAGNRFSTAQGLDTGNLEAALGGGLGNTAYQDTLAQRDYDQSRQLAEETARLNKPDLLQQVLSGIGGVGSAAGQVYGAYGKGRTPQPQNPWGGMSRSLPSYPASYGQEGSF